jgi:sucrose-6-phosphate hydrolase SacC (GH32 family)
MVLILGGKERVIRFFSSDNMVDWEKAGDIRRPWAAECIDIFRLPVDGDRGNMKWVIADASYDYEVGEFDGKVFSSTQDTQQGDFGARCFYAAQVFNNGPGGRVVQIGWMNDKRPDNVFLANDMPFNQQMSFPTELTLRTTPQGVRLFRWPVREIEGLYARSHSFRDLTVESANRALAGISPELVDMSLEFEPGADRTVTLSVRGLEVVYGRIKSYRTRKGERKEVKSFAFGDCMVPAPVIDGKVKLRVLVDRTSIEMFVNDGATVGTSYAVPAAANRDIRIRADGAVRIGSIEVNELRSAWQQAE